MNDKNLLPEKDLTELLEQEAEKIDANLDLWPALERQLKLSQTTSQPAPESTLPLLYPEATPATPKPIFTLPRVVKFALGIAAVLAIAFIVGVAFLPGKGAQSVPASILGPNQTVPAATSTPHVVTGTLKTTLTGHPEAVRALAWKSDGTELASGSDDGLLNVWDAGTWQLTGSYGAGAATAGWPYSVGWKDNNNIVGISSSIYKLPSPDGKLTLTRNGQDTFEVQKYVALNPNEPERPVPTATSGAPTQNAVIATLSVSSGSIGQIIWSPDSKIIVGEGFAAHGSGPAGPGDVRVWFWRSDGTLIATIENIFFPINSMAWSPDSKVIAITAKGNGLAGLWSPEGNLIKFISEDYVVWQFAWSPDGQTLAAACSDNTVRLFGKTGNLVDTLAGHQDSVASVAWSPDGKTLASGSGDKTVKLWTIK